MNSNDAIISTLNDLIEISRDGELGFHTCAKDLDSSQLKTLFTSRSQGCATAVAELQELVRSLGGAAESESSVSGSLHRRWVDIKSAILGKNQESILSECERGEDVALHAYRQALAKDLPSPIRLVVERQYAGVQKNHDEVKALRDQAKVRG